ncbi:MAG: ATP-dependent helicase HrpB [Planctomycetota bacterium]
MRQLCESGFGDRKRIVLVEPRRVATRAAARRMASETGSKVGDTIGYRVRFDRKVSRRTQVEVMTEGLLLRRLQRDPFLEDIAVVIFDEIHERSVDAEVSLALTRKVQLEARDDLKIVAMSATLDAPGLARYLGDAPIVESEGRLHPVTVTHRPSPTQTPLEEQVRAAVDATISETTGDLLVFLPGLREIRRAKSAIGARDDVTVLELYGDLPPERQDAVLRSGDGRRVILSTNVAESSITLEGIEAVIDSGWMKQLRVDASTGLNQLETTRVSRASADQRAGRAGRLGPGRCVRLYSVAEERALEAHDGPEIERVDLTPITLQLRAWGERDLTRFDWVTSPPEESLAHADEVLRMLGAFEGEVEHAQLTPRGHELSQFALHPRLAALLLASHRWGHASTLARAAALISERDPFIRDDRRAPDTESDIFERVRALDSASPRGGHTPIGEIHREGARFVQRAERDLLARLRDTESASDGTDPLQVDREEACARAILAAFPDRVARRRAHDATRAVMVGGRGVRLAGSCGVRHAEFFVAVDVDGGRRGTARSEAQVRRASAIQREWLDPIHVRDISEHRFDSAKEAVVLVRQRRYFDLVLDEHTGKAPPSPEAEHILAEAAQQQLDRALNLDEGTLGRLLARLRFLATHRPELDFPTWDATRFAEWIPSLVGGRTRFAELRRIPLVDQVLGSLSHDQRTALAREAPESITVPSGSQRRLDYDGEQPPIVAVRIQELFGLAESPRIAGGRVALVFHLLAPNGRPQQITDDLASFWANTYPQVRKDLRGRYPKHAWPEDPTTADAERSPKRRR